MAEYNKTIVTLKGLQLISKVHQGMGSIKFTRFKTGNGIYAYDKNEIEKMEDLLNVKQGFSITKIARESDVTVMLTLAISNINLQSGYYVNEIGIFAMDPNEGEVLYAVTTSKESNIDYLPQYNGVSPSKIMIDQYITMSNSDQVSITINPESPNIEFEDWGTQIPPSFEDSMSKLQSGETLSNLVSNIKSSIMGLSDQLDEIELLDTAITVEDRNQHFKGEKLNEVLDELFTFADDGRKAIVTAIGVPATQSDTFELLSKRIDDAQSDLRVAANNKGANIPMNPTFPEIIEGINATGHYLKPAQISDLAAEAGFTAPGQITLTWKNPITDPNFSGVMIRFQQGSYPVSPTGGTVLYDSNGMLPAETRKIFFGGEGVKYYFRAFSYAIVGSERLYTDSLTGAQTSATAYRAKGMVVITVSKMWTVPHRVTDLEVFLVGGGAAGYPGSTREASSYNTGYPGGGGGSGYTLTATLVVNPGDQLAAVIGAGGMGTMAASTNGSATTFGNLRAEGGVIGGPNQGGKGGSGGGDGTCNNSGNAGDGGWNGSNGTTGYISPSNKNPSTYGIGQGKTTRAFAESTGTLYAGGGSGGGGPWRGQPLTSQGIAGAGGGGSGNSSGNDIGNDGLPGSAGELNTGGGGGGGGADVSYRYRNKGGNGGSGVIIVRWGYN